MYNKFLILLKKVSYFFTDTIVIIIRKLYDFLLIRFSLELLTYSFFMVLTNYQNFVFSQLFNFQVTNKYGEWLAVMLCYWFDNYGTSILFEIVMDEARDRRSKRRLI